MSGTGPSQAVAVLGGTFDPVHEGHLRAADWVRRVFSVPRVLLVPCAIPPHKARPDLTPARDRMAMLRLAVGGRTGLEASDLEIARGGVSYTVVTLRTLRDGTPSLEPLLVVGWDALLEVESWHQHDALLREFDVVAVDRPGPAGQSGRTPGRSVARLLVEVPCADGAGAGWMRPPHGSRVFRLPIPPVPVSSSEIRRLAGDGSALAGLVPDSVARYIRDHGLYRKEGGR